MHIIQSSSAAGYAVITLRPEAAVGSLESTPKFLRQASPGAFPKLWISGPFLEDALEATGTIFGNAMQEFA